MSRQGNTEHSHTKFRETTADGRTFERPTEVGGAAKQAGSGRVQAARDAIHGNAFGAPGKPTVGSPGPARAGNQPHTAEYQGAGQKESSGSRAGNSKAVDVDIDAPPQRHTVGGKVQKTSKERFATRANGQQN